MNLTLSLLPERYAVCRLMAEDSVPAWAPVSAASPGPGDSEFVAIARTAEELSIVCGESMVPESVRSDRGWRCLKVLGPIDLSLTGVLAAILAPLAEAQINIFAVSTFDTDYVFVKDERLAQAVAALIRAGHRIESG